MADKVFKTLSTLLVIGLCSVIIWQAFPFERFIAPCSKPVEYSIGSFDKRFDISEANFVLALKDAEAIWEKPLGGKNLFNYNPKSDHLKVNLIYDYRQQVTEELTDIETEVKVNEESYQSLEERYKLVKAEYEKLKTSYEAKAALFNQHNDAYEKRVDEWNAGNHTAKSTFNSLESERLALEKEMSQLHILEAQLNSKVREVNTLVDKMNRLARDLNLNVTQYNTIGALRGDTFTGGVYISSAEGEHIDIFEFKNHDKLVRTLAHELGHALGLDHLDDPNSIMYKFNEGTGAKLTQADLTALKTLCKIK